MFLSSSRKKVEALDSGVQLCGSAKGDAQCPDGSAQVPQQVLTAVTCLTSLIHRPFPLSFPIPRPFF